MRHFSKILSIGDALLFVRTDGGKDMVRSVAVVCLANRNH